MIEERSDAPPGPVAGPASPGQRPAVRTVGVEEEFLLVSPDGARAMPVASRVLAAHPDDDAPADDAPAAAGDDSFCAELQEQQVETNTRPHLELGAIKAELEQLRRRAARAAEREGARLLASGTCPVAAEPVMAPSRRYERMAERIGLTATNSLICGCHVHVSVADDEEAVAVLDRIRVWLPVLLALSANSPFWQARDTGYASYRAQIWTAWPTAGPTDVFGSAQAYRRTVDTLLSSGVLLDEKMVYFDARLSSHCPTVEIRAADVCLRAQDAVLVAALCRGLVEIAARAWRAGEPTGAEVPGSLVRLARWQAARHGMAAELVHPLLWHPRPAEAVARALVEHVRPALRDSGDETAVEDLLEDVLRRGTGADRQREVLERTGSLSAVAADGVQVSIGAA